MNIYDSSVTLQNIPNNLTTNILYYDSTTKSVSYGLAPTGANLSLTNTALTGIPTAPTATLGTSTQQIATTAFVSNTVTSNLMTPSVKMYTFSTAGTLVTDNLTDNVGVSLITSSIVFSITLTAVFTLWYLREKTLAIHSIYTPTREAFYWLTILFTFALGTATGDLFAERLALGYARSLLVFAGVIALIAVLWKQKVVNPIFAFWAVYVLTRPLGASIGDLLSQDKKNGGFGLGTTVTSLIFLTLITITVTYLVKSKKDQIKVDLTKIQG